LELAIIKLNNKLLLTIFFSILILPTLAKDYLFDVQIINIEAGLPNRRVFDIAQDKEGFIWISTPGKISRYDGHHFKTYDADILNIPDYAGVSMAFDQNNNLWYCINSGTKGKIYGGVINSKAGEVYNLETFTNNQFTSKEIVHISRSALVESEWFLTTLQGKIYKYNGDFEEIYRYPKTLDNRLRAQQRPNGDYWIMHYNELTTTDKRQIPQTIRSLNENGDRLFISKIIQQQPTLIIETLDPSRGIKYYTLKEGQLIPYAPINYQPDEIFGLFHQTPDYVVFANKDEIIIQDTTGTPIFRFNEFDNRIFGEIKIKCNTVYLDRQNILWLATENGLIKITQNKNPFTKLLPKNSTRGIYLDGADQLLVGGYKDNIRCNLNTGEQVSFFESSALKRSPIMAIHKDSESHLWVGLAKSMLLEYLPGQTKPIKYKFNLPYPLYLPYENPITKTLWVGTNNGLYYLDKVTEQFIPQTLPIASLNVEVRHFHQNPKGIWAITSKGIFLIDGSTEKVIKHFTIADGLPNDNFTHLHEDKEGIFWLTSKGGGLIRWDRSKNNFSQFNQEKGLSNNVIYAVYEDDYENLWLPSDYGLMCFDKNSLTTQVYLPQNGIAHEEFNTFSHFKAADGTMYFGGLNGVTLFHPKDIQKLATQTPPLYITNVRILTENEKDFVNKTRTYQQSKGIYLSPNDRILELELSLLDYVQSSKNQYAYQIEGYQHQWVYTRENKISLINLPYGQYTLNLKGRGASGSWSKKILKIPLVIKKPFYLQWWFMMSILGSIALSIFVGIKWRIASLEKDRKRLEEEVKKRTLQIKKDNTIISEQTAALQELDKAKTRFFSNITHEFRTPLTLIIGPLQQMIRAPKEKISPNRLKGILKNAQGILTLVNQLLDISKLEGGKMKLEITRGDIIDYTTTGKHILIKENGIKSFIILCPMR